MKLFGSLHIALLFIRFLAPDSAHAIFEADATFESMYTKQGLGWIGWAAGGALAIGVAVFFTGGAASAFVPVGVASLAKWLGGLGATKLTGAAALNHGLALLGGGAVSAGGLGKAGGAAVLSAVLTLSAEVSLLPIEAASTVLFEDKKSGYSYTLLLEESRELASLPLPTNTSGSDAYEDAMEALRAIDDSIPLSIGGNRVILKEAIHRLRWSSDSYERAMNVLEDVDEEQPLDSSQNHEIVIRAVETLLYDATGISELKDATLLALLHSVLGDYQRCNQYAGRALEIAKSEGEDEVEKRASLAMFLSATTTLYMESFDLAEILATVETSLVSDPKNPLVPLSFAIFLDRIELRLVDDSLDEEVLLQIFQVMKSPALEKFRLQNYVLLLARYLKRMEYEQQKVMVLATTLNATIRNHPRTVDVIRNSLATYKTLLDGANIVESSISTLELEDDLSREQVARLRSAFRHYDWERENLSAALGALEEQQSP